jgi:16S rRNA (guanine966-N2)-methyltransferase
LLRIIAGRFKGKRLAVPDNQAIRPTADRVRESLFNILAHGIDDFALEGIDVLDLFSGTGALGLEALSRGAKSCVFVDDSADARGLIRTNVEALELTGATKIFRRDATQLGPAQRLGPFGLVLIDPPYAKGLGELALSSATAGGWLTGDAIAVLEERADATLELPVAGFSEVDRRIWGDTQVVILRRQPKAGGPAQ